MKTVNINDLGINNQLDVGFSTLAEADNELNIKHTLRRVLIDWENLLPQQILIKRLGGLTNLVFSATITDDYLNMKNSITHSSVVVKIVPEASRENISPFLTFKKIAQAAQRKNKMSPELLFKDDIMEIEEFIINWEMTGVQMCQQDYRLWMMQTLADFLDTNFDKVHFFLLIN